MEIDELTQEELKQLCEAEDKRIKESIRWYHFFYGGGIKRIRSVYDVWNGDKIPFKQILKQGLW